MTTQPSYCNAELGGKLDKHQACRFQSDKPWFDLRFDTNGTIIKPEELEKDIRYPREHVIDSILDRIHGSMIGMALGDALGAHVEFRPREYMLEHPVTDLQGGGTWGLKQGQFTDDTSMALCLAISLVARQDYVPYDQLVRYKWWHQQGYMSSTGKCFDIGAATRKSLAEFERRQKKFANEHNIPFDQIDFLLDPKLLKKFDVNCSEAGVAGNGALMRLAPVPLFFHENPAYAVEYSGRSGLITHGDEKAYDACRYYGALIVAAVKGSTKNELLDENFYENHVDWFGGKSLHPDIENIAKGSYKKQEGYDKGIRGKGYIVSALEAALWAFCFDDDSFNKGVLAAINLGDDTDTTAAIYGQLAGAHYGYKELPKEWVGQVYAKEFIKCLSIWVAHEGKRWARSKSRASIVPLFTDFDRKTRPRRGTSIDAPQFLKPPDSDKQLPTTRPKSAERNDSTFSSPQRIYLLKNLKTSDDVSQLIRDMGDDYVTYANIFKSKDIDGYWLLNHTEDENLKNYGITRADHRRAILRKIGECRKKCPEQFSTQT